MRREGGTVFVGRGRAVPESGYAWARENAPRHYDLSAGLANGRAGLWSTVEGKMARDLMEAVHDPDDIVVGTALAELLDIVQTTALENAEETAYGMMASAKNGCHNASALRNGADDRFAAIKAERERADEALGKMIAHYGARGLPGAWKAAQECPGLKKRSGDPASRRRVAMIAARFAEIECPSREIEAERFAHVVWRDTPAKYRSPVEPPVRDYIPKVPRPRPIRKLRVRPPLTPDQIERQRRFSEKMQAFLLKNPGPLVFGVVSRV